MWSQFHMVKKKPNYASEPRLLGRKSDYTKEDICRQRNCTDLWTQLLNRKEGQTVQLGLDYTGEALR
jgi:hypothetical protein